MLPVSFPESNHVYRNPNGFDTPAFRSPMRIDEDGNQVHTIVSFWKFSKEDLETIEKTGGIYLSVVALKKPPISLATENPFEL